ncbi:MAG: hypothetical protein HY046_13675 [Acidobacteria bacterium]|nr:hypothetical protein [Acidobacteriota bacterium]
MARTRNFAFVTLAAILLLAIETRAQSDPPPKEEKKTDVPTPLPKGKKLVLTDGTFQVCRTYERKGDRVRYFSSERSEWEEIPADIVDWLATAKAEAEEVKGKQDSIEKIKAIEAAERTKDLEVDASIEIAPGVFLPDGPGIWVVEDKIPLPMNPVGADIKRSKGRLLAQIFVPVPVVPTLHKVQIAGKQATLRITTGQPEFYMRTEDGHEPELELIRAVVKGGNREVQRISTDIAGQQTTDRKSIGIERWRLARGLFRLTLSQSLDPGEYAIAEILPEGVNLYVWDFAVDSVKKAAAVKK